VATFLLKFTSITLDFRNVVNKFSNHTAIVFISECSSTYDIQCSYCLCSSNTWPRDPVYWLTSTKKSAIDVICVFIGVTFISWSRQD